MRHTRAIIGAGLVLAAFSSCINPNIHRQVLAANEKLQGQREEAVEAARAAQARIRDLQAEVDRMAPLVKDAAYLKKQKALVDSILKRFKEGGGGTLPKGVSTANVEGGLALRVEGKVLFASGSDKLSSGGQATLKELVSTIRSYPKRIRIAGHTDDDPIKRSSWKTNMRLSVARALTVREYLISAGVPEGKMSVAGYGEFRPVDANDKAKNRRTEIVLLR